MDLTSTERARPFQSLGLPVGQAGAGGLAGDLTITGLSVDSRDCRPGHLFFAIKGTDLDGAEFAPFAVRQGAVGVVCSEAGAAVASKAGAPLIVVGDVRLALSRVAARFYGDQPGTMVAVTGTNGKTSVATFLRQIWIALGRLAVNFGTTGVEGAVAAPLSHTTPEPITLHALLAGLAAEGVSHGAMEASSHGLAQHRLDGVRLRAAALTNVTRDHMDYHADHDDYVAAKLGLFDRVLPTGGAAVLNVDDPVHEKARQVCARRDQRVIGVGTGPAADLRLIDCEFHAQGQSITVTWRGDAARRIELPLIGGFQAENALTAAALAIAVGEDAEQTFGALPRLAPVRGRMELAATRLNGGAAYVDYAHTPDGVASACRALRPHTPGRLICLVGAGGDRDPGKRPLMGAAAAKGADHVIVTDDNPRTEDPAAIRKAVLAGAPEADEVGDRLEAILHGIDMLGPDDRLLIAGKGHETVQIIGADAIPFDDAEQARAAVIALDGGGAS